MSFDKEVQDRVRANGGDAALKASAHAFLEASLPPKYSYNFSWLGRPIIQYPQDMVAMQEIIWRVQPNLIIETGIAHGGSLIFSASMLELLASCTGIQGEVVAIEAHPMHKRIHMIQGSSIDPTHVATIAGMAQGRRCVLVCLDSKHTHAHVLAELEAYAPLVTVGSYCVVFDTVIEDVPKQLAGDRPWGPGNNPKTAVQAWIGQHPEFSIDHAVDHKLLISVAPSGYLQRIR